MPSMDHTHKYVRYTKRQGYYRCALPDCTHFQDREALVGKYSLCNDCHSIFTLDYEDLRKAKPRCLNCANTKKARQFREFKSMTKELTAPSLSYSLQKEIEGYQEEQHGDSTGNDALDFLNSIGDSSTHTEREH